MRIALFAAIIVALSGCATSHSVTQDNARRLSSVSQEAHRLLDGQAVRNPPRKEGAIISDVPYVDPTPIQRSDRVPEALTRHVAMNEPAGLPIQALMHQLRQIPAFSQMRITYDTDIIEDAAGQGSASQPASPPPTISANPQQALIVDSTLNALAGLSVSPGSTVTNAGSVQIGGVPAVDLGTRVAIVYSGPADGLLDQVAAGLGASWRYIPAENRIHFARYVTETFSVATVPGSASSEAKVGGQQQTTGSVTIQTTAESTNRVTSEIDIWKGIEEGVKQLLSSRGSLSINQTTASITVRDRADRVEAIRKYIEETNKALTYRVDVEVRVFRVANKRGDNRAFSLDMLVNQFSTNPEYRFQLFTPRNDPSALGSAVFQVPSRSGNNINRYGGSSVALDSLSTAIEATEVTRQSISTVNNMPAPVKIVRRTSYLASTTPLVGVGSSIGGNAVSAGASLTPGQVETGLNMQITPSVQSNGQQVYLQVMLTLSTLDRLRVISSGGQSIESPEVSSREFLQRVWLNSGDTLILAGLEQYDTGNERVGVIDAVLWPLAGSRNRTNNRESIVVTITPVVSRVNLGV